MYDPVSYDYMWFTDAWTAQEWLSLVKAAYPTTTFSIGPVRSPKYTQMGFGIWSHNEREWVMPHKRKYLLRLKEQHEYV
jgi:hypothetical protein